MSRRSRSAQVVALIPARGGSKGVPRKNLREVGGHPLVGLAVHAAKAAKTIERVIVSTDDAEIAETARRYGAEVPFLRPASLARDLTPDWPVFEHALRWLEEHEGACPEIVVHVRPTSPLRRAEDLDAAVRLLRRHPEADCVRSVSEAREHPRKMWTITRGRLRPWATPNGTLEAYNLPRQQLETVYVHNGVVDAIRSRTIVSQRSMSGRRILPLVTPARTSLDIDDERDLWLAERLAVGVPA